MQPPQDFTMRSVLPLMLGLIVGCGSAARTGPDGGKDVGKTGMPACTRDEDCPDGFCDTTGLCGVATPRGHFGWQPCTEFKDMSTDIPLKLRLMRLGICGAYRCMDGRCRSCRTDYDCNHVDGFEGVGFVDGGVVVDVVGFCMPIGADAPEYPDGRRCGRATPDGGYTQ
jgi:hypothetical protein